jgi:hypothetical protein
MEITKETYGYGKMDWKLLRVPPEEMRRCQQFYSIFEVNNYIQVYKPNIQFTACTYLLILIISSNLICMPQKEKQSLNCTATRSED